ncbi:hypothetical protein [Nonomuraea jiangxiensis]|uniref:Uncharacterized protein n=1 Tax=Nonomuraea jiangxiensis TaxID=633440 RepID=A0A1G8TUJ9_9ACTN|nr:hypothetical protein [Nonomuraea jiangxiensis]SDJ45182.1 hypothetical protein SAMN05421869_110291 [Nonomuraea jiangxiensis]
MTFKSIDLPGHEGFAAPVLPNGEPAPSAGVFTRTFVGYQAGCSCGWADRRKYPATPAGAKEVEYRWWSRHATPLLAAAPPGELVIKSNLLCERISKLIAERPVAALTLLSQLETWQRALLEQAVAGARQSGASWSEVGEAMGISKQSAHERFRAHVST